MSFLEQEDTRALTLWRPWDQAILYGGKRIENRKGKPWACIMGQYICLHAGQKYDKDGAVEMIRSKLYTPPSPSASTPGVIVGVAKVTGVIVVSDDPWFSGPYGWVLKDVMGFIRPVEAKGAQGLWKVRGELLERVREEFTIANSIPAW